MTNDQIPKADVEVATSLMSEAVLTFSQIIGLEASAQSVEDYERVLVLSCYALRDLGRRMDKAQEALGGVRGGWFDDTAAP